MADRALEKWISLARLAPSAFADRFPHPVLIADVPLQQGPAEPTFETRSVTDDTLAGLVLGTNTKLHIFEIRSRSNVARRLVWIGRTPNCDVVIDNPAVSKLHASIQVLPGGGFSICDMGSRNGTVVNGQKLNPREPMDLPDGAVLYLGPLRMKFCLPEAFHHRLKEIVLSAASKKAAAK